MAHNGVMVLGLGLLVLAGLVSFGFSLQNGYGQDGVIIGTDPSIPDWVDQNFVWYGKGLISQTELVNAIKYLTDNDIIFISEDADAHQKAAGKQQTITAHTGSEEMPIIEKILTFLEGVEKSIHKMEGHAGEQHYIEKFGPSEILQQGIVVKSTLNVGEVKNAGLSTGPRSMGNPLPQVMSANVCGDTICDKPMSMEEKIQMYLKSRGLD